MKKYTVKELVVKVLKEQTIMIEGIPLKIKYELTEETGDLKLSLFYNNVGTNKVTLHSFTYPVHMEKLDRKEKINDDIHNVIATI